MNFLLQCGSGRTARLHTTFCPYACLPALCLSVGRCICHACINFASVLAPPFFVLHCATKKQRWPKTPRRKNPPNPMKPNPPRRVKPNPAIRLRVETAQKNLMKQKGPEEAVLAKKKDAEKELAEKKVAEKKEERPEEGVRRVTMEEGQKRRAPAQPKAAN